MKEYKAHYVTCWVLNGASINSEHNELYTTDFNVVEHYRYSHPNLIFTECKAIAIYIDLGDSTEQDENCGIFILGKKIM